MFQLTAPYAPAGDQPQAIEALVDGLRRGKHDQTLLGVTGSGKTFVMANVIAQLQKPALVLSHNKTLTAQLYSEFRQFFPHNAVEYFVSYYDYYQPEAYLPATDVYIEKDAAINDNLERLRLSATAGLLTRRDVVVVASVSCIYGLGAPDQYREAIIPFQVGATVSRRRLLEQLLHLRYERNDYAFQRGKFRLRGDAIEIFPAYLETALRVEFFGDEIERLTEFAPLTGTAITNYQHVALYPATHFILSEDGKKNAVAAIEEELETRLQELNKQNKILEAQRLESRTRYDLEMLNEIGYCQGVENYSRHFDGRAPGSRPSCLLDYFPANDYLLFIDESHVTLPQLRGMYNGDRARKTTLVEHGFRLPSALDNRPMTFAEFTARQPPTIYVSATPAADELQKSAGEVTRLVVRPTGLVDPPITVRPTTGQVPDIMREIQIRAAKGERTLITTLTKRLAEDLDRYCREHQLRTEYLHSDIDTLERVEILKDLRLGNFDALIGVNLLREGLDLPEVSLVVILDADKQGFLRSTTSLIQTIGRCARHLDGRVIMYADGVSDAMRAAMDENEKRRAAQLKYNEENHITPRSVARSLATGWENFFGAVEDLAPDDNARQTEISVLQTEMVRAAEEMRFEDAAKLRDRLLKLNAPINYLQESPVTYGKKRRKTLAGNKKRRGGE
ncbi:UvrABC system protein B [Planctomycetales bacterium]|nr:UvrABC system protein B [Planctomycetales bacterium]